MIAFLACVLSASSPQVSANPDVTWWNTDWSYRKAIQITDVSPENCQIRIALNKVDNLDSHCLDNFQDVRFIENETTGELAFWIEDNTMISGDSCVFWVRRIDNCKFGDNTIYVYYGNSSATWKSDIENTFVFGDDFNRTVDNVDNINDNLSGFSSFNILPDGKWAVTYKVPISGDLQSGKGSIYLKTSADNGAT